MKKILHFQIAVNERGQPIVPMEWTVKFINIAQSRIGNDWAVIASPCAASILEDNGTLKNFLFSNISKEELLDLIKE